MTSPSHEQEKPNPAPAAPTAISPAIVGGAVALGVAIGLWQIARKASSQQTTQPPQPAPPAAVPEASAPAAQPARPAPPPSPVPRPRPAPPPPVDDEDYRPKMPVYISFGTTGIDVPY